MHLHQASDGFIRVSLNELLSLTIIHLMSGLDGGDPSNDVCGRPTTISGYTEWVSKSEPAISIGWDWSIEPSVPAGWCRRVSAPRANVMVVDSNGADLPWKQNLEWVGAVVDALPWADLTHIFLSV